jgi:hypothetical protein
MLDGCIIQESENVERADNGNELFKRDIVMVSEKADTSAVCAINRPLRVSSHFQVQVGLVYK